MKIALAQINPTVADLEGNVRLCLEAARRASADGADLVVLPGMAVTGSPPRDILFDSSFREAAMAALLDLARRCASFPPVLAGSIYPAEAMVLPHPGLWKAALLLERGKIRLASAQRVLRSDDIFLEPRWFLPGAGAAVIETAGRRVGVLLGQDLLMDDGAFEIPGVAQAAAVDLVVCLADDPFRQGILPRRIRQAGRAGLPLVFANLAGANDDVIYDGRSFLLDRQGDCTLQLAGFRQDYQVAALDAPGSALYPEPNREEELYQALVLGVRDFFDKNGLPQAFVGVSGGVDSSLTAILAVDALGPQRVTGVALPSRYTDLRSTECARQLCEAIGARFEVVELETMHRALEAGLGEALVAGVSGENIQARLRMVVLMAYVNGRGGALINTTNKTELALGYGTLYGDSAGAVCPLGDLTKPQVTALARWINACRNVIPAFVLARPPSAELRLGQVDPFDYDRISPEMERLVLNERSNLALQRSEHKRRGMGVILKVSEKAFGPGRIVPITRK
jgi:NAD+ synthetase